MKSFTVCHSLHVFLKFFVSLQYRHFEDIAVGDPIRRWNDQPHQSTDDSETSYASVQLPNRSLSPHRQPIRSSRSLSLGEVSGYSESNHHRSPSQEQSLRRVDVIQFYGGSYYFILIK